MKYYSLLLATTISLILSACESNVKESTIHRRNFSKNVFEEEFASVEVGCDTVNMKVLLPNTKWLTIDLKHQSDQDPKLHAFSLNKKLELDERTYRHELVLEKIQNGAFMFRYKGIQNIIDTLPSMLLSNLNLTADTKLDSSRIFSFQGTEYYKLKESDTYPKNAKIIYKSMKTEDQGRVVCKCDYYL